MTNGVIDRAQLEALKSAQPEEQMEFLLVSAMQTRHAVEDIPDQIAAAIQKQRRKDYRTVAAVATVISVIAALAVDLIVHFV